MTHLDQTEFYTCPICGAGTGNDVDELAEHDCPLEEEYVKSFTTPTLEEMKKQRRQEYGPQYVDITGFGDFANIVCITNEDIDKIIEETYSTAKREVLREYEGLKVLSDAVMNAPIGHRITINHDTGSDEWTLTKQNPLPLREPV